MSLQADPGSMSALLARPRAAALLLALAATATVGGALFIEHVMGVKPCDLCLTQRIPYYAGVPLALAVAWLGGAASRRRLAIAGLLLLGVLFAAGAGLGAYHAGVEWGWWPGPSGCTGAIERPAGMGDFLRQLETVRVVRCDEVALRILGLSLAAWNAVISAAMAVFAVACAVAAGRRAQA
jgi:disulfide bond formation protein DsbB